MKRKLFIQFFCNPLFNDLRLLSLFLVLSVILARRITQGDKWVGSNGSYRNKIVIW